MFAGARTEIENVVGRENRIGIVFDDQQGVAQIAQTLQDLNQAVGVARMKADGRLIQHVKRAHQMRAERCGELNALRFAAGKRRGKPVEREVIEPDLVQKSQAAAEFLPGFYRRSAVPPD